MDVINEKLLIELYSKYINDNQYVYYKERDTIIIMKIISNLKCVCDINPKKYYSDNLKVILMFDVLDPYKLVFNATKYKINDIINSYCYLDIICTYNLIQEYYISNYLWYECIYITKNNNNKLCREYYDESENIKKIFIINDNKYNGIYKEYYESGYINYECNYINDIRNGLFIYYFENGQIWYKFNYINDKLHGIWKEYYKDSFIKKECNYELGKLHGLYKEYYKNSLIQKECNYELGKLHGLYKEYYESGKIKQEYNYELGILKN